MVVSGNPVTFHLPTADPEFLDKLAVPFAFILPASTSTKNVDIPPPGTGPYKWAQYAPTKQIKLVRNTYFKEWSKDAQPEGNPDSIVEKFGLSVESEVTAVQNDQADWIFDQPPADRLGELSSAKYSSRVHVNPLTSTWYFAFNVNEKPFSNLKSRQGVNFSTDRNPLVKVVGGPKLSDRNCQSPPPYFPRYKHNSPNTHKPDIWKWAAQSM